MRSYYLPTYLTLTLSTFLLWLLPLFSGYAATHADNNEPLIVVLGDSLSAGYGIDQSLGWVNLLSKQLKENKYPYRVVNASISGETSAGGLSRLPPLLKQKPGIVIIELGANDGLRGLSLLSLKKNLEKMITLSRSTGAKVLLIGMELPPNYGPEYIRAFQDIYPVLANKYHLKRVPFLLEGVASRRELMQADNLHPTADAQPILLKNIWSQLETLLNKSTTQ